MQMKVEAVKDRKACTLKKTNMRMRCTINIIALKMGEPK